MSETNFYFVNGYCIEDKTMPQSDSEDKVYSFIVDYINCHGYAPVYRDICKGVGINSTSAVLSRLISLVDRGLISLSGASRGITLGGGTRKNIHRPVYKCQPFERKKCVKCGKIAVASEFVKDKRALGGYSPRCKSCERKRYHERKENTPKTLTCTDCNQTKRSYEFSKYGRSKTGYATKCKACLRKKYLKTKNTPGILARQAVRNAVRNGTLKNPKTMQCSGTGCPNIATSYHHSKGYDPANWLEVTPLCDACHGKEHRST